MKQFDTISDASRVLCSSLSEDEQVREIIFPVILKGHQWSRLAPHKEEPLDAEVSETFCGEVAVITLRRFFAAYLINSLCNQLRDEIKAPQEVKDRAIDIITDFVRSKLCVEIDDIDTSAPRIDLAKSAVVHEGGTTINTQRKPVDKPVKFRTVKEAIEDFLSQIPDFIRQRYFDPMESTFDRISNMPIKEYGEEVLGIYIKSVYRILVFQLQLDIELKRLTCRESTVGTNIQGLLQTVEPFSNQQAVEVRATLNFMKDFVEKELGAAGKFTFEEIPS